MDIIQLINLLVGSLSCFQLGDISKAEININRGKNPCSELKETFGSSSQGCLMPLPP